mmetsp:Transcript_24159/g.36540  ORF Transcript_24159/g.36540 Transcript_24159/m.36540 type:complete len:553 (-) Transcript_24159:7-1665(-)
MPTQIIYLNASASNHNMPSNTSKAQSLSKSRSFSSIPQSSSQTNSTNRLSKLTTKFSKSSSRSFDGAIQSIRRTATNLKVRLRRNKKSMPQPYIDVETDTSYDVEVDNAANPLNGQQVDDNHLEEYDDYYDDEDDDDYYDDFYDPEDLELKGGEPCTPVTKRGDSSSDSGDEDEESVASQFYWETRGEVLDDKYRVVDSLGKGTFGRVVECYIVNPNNWKEWLGLGSIRGLMRRSTSDVYAVKIVRTKYTNDAKEEATVLRSINNATADSKNPDERGQRYFPILYEEFTLPSRHYCLVMEKLGQSLYDVMKHNDFQPFSLSTVKSIAVQLLDALDYLHSVCHIVHTDLKPENLLLVPTGRYSPNDTRIKLIDFGSAIYDNDPHKASIINTREYRAPEVVLRLDDWSYPSDIWVAACVLFELATSCFLFNPQNTEEHLQLIEQKIGKFPKRMVVRGKSKDSFDIPFLTGSCSYRSSGDCSEENNPVPVMNRLDDNNDNKDHGTLEKELGEIGSSGLYKLLRACLQIPPRARPKAKKALQLAKKIELTSSDGKQ